MTTFLICGAIIAIGAFFAIAWYKRGLKYILIYKILEVDFAIVNLREFWYHSSSIKCESPDVWKIRANLDLLRRITLLEKMKNDLEEKLKCNQHG